jgi:hypothetical protein
MVAEPNPPVGEHDRQRDGGVHAHEFFECHFGPRRAITAATVSGKFGLREEYGHGRKTEFDPKATCGS